MPKVVFSKTLDQASWNNTRLVKSDIASEVRRMKNQPRKGMAILGSGSIVSQLAPEGLIDEYQFIVNSVALCKGRTMFDGIKEKLNLKLTKTRIFNNGKVFLSYQPQREGAVCRHDRSLTLRAQWNFFSNSGNVSMKTWPTIARLRGSTFSSVSSVVCQ